MPIQYLKDRVNQQTWGTAKRTGEFRLYAIPLWNPLNPLDITGFQIIDVSYNEERGKALTDLAWRGDNVKYLHSVTPADIKNISATLKYPHGIWSFIDGMLEFSEQGECFGLLRVPECSEPCERFFNFYELVYGQARELSVFVGVSDNNQVIDRESDLTIINTYQQWELNRFAKVEDFMPLYGATFMVSGCPGCTCDPLKTVYAAGNDGATEPTFYISHDGLGEETEFTSLNNVIANSDTPTGIWANQHVILLPYANNSSPLLGTTGGILYSYDGVIWQRGVDDTGADLTEPIYFVRYANGKWIAGGGNSTLLESMNGRTWRPIVHTLIGTFADGTYDSKQVKFYLAGFNGIDGLAVEVDGRNLITNISAEVNPPGRLFSVKRIGNDHIAFGGEYGAFIEKFKQYEYVSHSFGSLSSDIIRAINGDPLMLYFAMNNQLFERNIFTGMEITSLDTGLTIAGNIQDIAIVRHPMRGNIKRLRAVTDQGEVISFEDCVPDACSFLQAQREALEACLCLC